MESGVGVFDECVVSGEEVIAKLLCVTKTQTATRGGVLLLRLFIFEFFDPLLSTMLELKKSIT